MNLGRMVFRLIFLGALVVQATKFDNDPTLQSTIMVILWMSMMGWSEIMWKLQDILSHLKGKS